MKPVFMAQQYPLWRSITRFGYETAVKQTPRAGRLSSLWRVVQLLCGAPADILRMANLHCEGLSTITRRRHLFEQLWHFHDREQHGANTRQHQRSLRVHEGNLEPEYETSHNTRLGVTITKITNTRTAPGLMTGYPPPQAPRVPHTTMAWGRPRHLRRQRRLIAFWPEETLLGANTTKRQMPALLIRVRLGYPRRVMRGANITTIIVAHRSSPASITIAP